MNNQFNYPVGLTKQRKGGYLVQFPDLPEAITQGENIGAKPGDHKFLFDLIKKVVFK